MRSVLLNNGLSATAHWPATARTLLAVGAVLLLTLLPHVTHLPFWIPLLVAGAWGWRVALEVRAGALPQRWLRSLIALTALILVGVSYRTLNGLEAGTALLATMAGMKLIETRGARDFTILIFIGLFLLFAELLYDQSIGMLPYLLLCTVLSLATLLRLHDGNAAMSYRAALAPSSRMLLHALPLAVLLFVFFPRLPGQLWAVPPRDAASSGLSDEMSPGDVATLTLSGAVVFRAEFTGEPPPPEQRYWRAIVLHDFDGRTWRRERSSLSVRQPTIDTINAYDYRLLLEPQNQHWIPVLDIPLRWSLRRSFMTGDLQLISAEPLTQLTAVDVRSATRYRLGNELASFARRIDTRLNDTNPRTRALAQRMRAAAGSDADYVAAVLRLFNQQAFVYTLEPPRLQTNPVDQFLFDTRRGFCEHYASAFTVLMRAAGIPARIVTGYQGGEYNALGSYLIVRESDAHAWSEVWLDGQGWVRIDPTAAVSPQRIERGIDSALGAHENVPGRSLRQNQLFNRLRLGWDAVNLFWKERIVQFDSNDQRSLLSRVGLDNTDWRSLALVLICVFAVFFLGLMGYLAWRYRPRRTDPVLKTYLVLKRKLQRRQIDSPAHEGPVDFLTRAAHLRPELATQLNEVRDLYVELRYGPRPDRQQLSRLRYVVDRFS